MDGHWAYDILKDGLELSCITENSCACDESPNCLIEPRDPEKRKTYGPVETAFELDGTTEVGRAKDNRTKFPGLYIDQPYDVTADYTILENKSVWMGATSRLNEDGTNGRFCGTTVESGNFYSLNFTFSTPDDWAICVPKLRPEEVVGGSPYFIEVWKNRTTRETGFPPIFSMGVGDAPLEFTNATVFVDFNATIGQYENCFEIRLAPGVYYLDEMIT